MFQDVTDVYNRVIRIRGNFIHYVVSSCDGTGVENDTYVSYQSIMFVQIPDPAVTIPDKVEITFSDGSLLRLLFTEDQWKVFSEYVLGAEIRLNPHANQA